MSAGGFLSRWSKRKLAASLAATREPAAADADVIVEVAAAPAAAPAPAVPPAGASAEARDRDAVEAALPPVEDLTLASDFTAFLKEEVSESLRRQALKKLFADPHFNQMDGLDIYIDDYSIADPIPPSMMEKLKHAREWLGEPDAPVETETQAAADLASPPVTDGEVVPSGAAADVQDEVGCDPARAGGGVSSGEGDDRPAGEMAPAGNRDERAG